MPVSLNLNQLFSNNAVSLLTAPISATDTSLTVVPGHGAMFPQPVGDGSDYFLITLEDQSALTREIIKVTARVGDLLLFNLADRGLEDTTVQSWSSSPGNETLVDHRITAETLARAMQKPISTVAAGTIRFNQPFTLSAPVSQTTAIDLQDPYQSGSTAVFVGGMRQKLGVDYQETAPTRITLQFALTQAMVDEGQHVTIDFVAA